MLISSRRYRVSNGFVHFPDWILAPLSLNEHQQAYVVVNDYLPSPKYPPIPEIVISAFPDDTWTDLWRIQTQFEPGMGRALDLNGFLLDRGLSILAYEVYEGSHGVEGNIFNSFHLIVSAKEYKSPNDRDSGTRSERPFARLWDLEDDLGVHFAQKLNFQNRKIPRLHVRRLAQHRILARSNHRGIRSVSLARHKVSIARGRSEPRIGFYSQDIDAELKKTRGAFDFGQELASKKGVYITPTVDAYERFIRVLPLDVTCPIHFAHIVCNKDDAVAVRVLSVLRLRDANIIKMQMRTGIGRWERSILQSLEKRSSLREGVAAMNTEEGRNNLMRMSITFSVDREHHEHKSYFEQLLRDLARELNKEHTEEVPLPRVKLEDVHSWPAIEGTFVITQSAAILSWASGNG